MIKFRNIHESIPAMDADKIIDTAEQDLWRSIKPLKSLTVPEMFKTKLNQIISDLDESLSDLNELRLKIKK